MRSLRKIVKSYRSVGERGPNATLATVVAADGPGHPGVGSRMLLIEGGHHSGLIGSDALHHELHEAARQADAREHPRTLGFATAASAAPEASRGSGQKVQVLLEPLSGRADEPAIRVLEHCLEHRTTIRQATVYAAPDSAELRVGDRLALDEQGQALTAPSAPELADPLEKTLEELPEGVLAQATTISLRERDVEILLERIEPPVGLIIFGGGLDACPLVKFAHELGWFVSVVDPDPARANTGRFPLADAVVVSRTDQIGERVVMDRRSAAVVMTHNPQQDKAILAALAPGPCSYIGFAPREYDPRELLEQELGPETARARVFAPAGLEIGALTAHETAVAVIAQIIRHFSGGTA